MSLRSALKAAIPIVVVAVAMTALTRAKAPIDALVDLRDVPPYEVSSAGFMLPAEQTLEVEAVGARRDDFWAGNAWILDALTREVVWELGSSPTSRHMSGMASFEGSVRLPAGQYVVHYAMFARPGDIRSWVTRALGALGLADDFRITIRGAGEPLSDSEIATARGAFAANAFVSFSGLPDDSREEIGFRVAEPTEVEVYAIGEVSEGEAHDYGWLMNTETGEVLWKLGADDSQPAGGAAKNRMARAVLNLDPGSYAAFAVTDGSHDASDWNAPPPYDPDYWGLTIRALGEAGEVEVYPYRPAPLENAFVSLTGLGDNAAVSEGFSLTRPLAIRVHALGEGMGGAMYDYGWILDGDTHQPVWTMDYQNTEPAGGAAKNRLTDEVVTLDPGNYVVYYVTDGSHSREEWNDTPPFDQDRWGITLLPAGDRPVGNTVRRYDPTADDRIIAGMVGIGDDESRSETFTLRRETDVRIYALGEGSAGDMYDYAWIEQDGSGRVVWRMEYRNTEHAGGASKNRVFDGRVTLPAGAYVVRYQSDGSHSFEGWNAAAPYDPFSYGVTIRR